MTSISNYGQIGCYVNCMYLHVYFGRHRFDTITENILKLKEFKGFQISALMCMWATLGWLERKILQYLESWGFWPEGSEFRLVLCMGVMAPSRCPDSRRRRLEKHKQKPVRSIIVVSIKTAFNNTSFGFTRWATQKKDDTAVMWCLLSSRSSVTLLLCHRSCLSLRFTNGDQMSPRFPLPGGSRCQLGSSRIIMREGAN